MVYTLRTLLSFAKFHGKHTFFSARSISSVVFNTSTVASACTKITAYGKKCLEAYACEGSPQQNDKESGSACSRFCPKITLLSVSDVNKVTRVTESCGQSQVDECLTSLLSVHCDHLFPRHKTDQFPQQIPIMLALRLLADVHLVSSLQLMESFQRRSLTWDNFCFVIAHCCWCLFITVCVYCFDERKNSKNTKLQ